MRKMIIVVTLALLLGCGSDKKDVAIYQLKTSLDSLSKESLRKDYIIDSLSGKYSQQQFLIRFTAQKCKKYASIVRRDPSQSVFIVNWIDRSFQWTEQKQ